MQNVKDSETDCFPPLEGRLNLGFCRGLNAQDVWIVGTPSKETGWRAKECWEFSFSKPVEVNGTFFEESFFRYPHRATDAKFMCALDVIWCDEADRVRLMRSHFSGLLHLLELFD